MKTLYWCVLAVLMLALVVPAGFIYSQTADSTYWPLKSTDTTAATSSANVVGAKEIIGAGPNGMVVASYNANGQRMNQGTFGWAQETAQDETRYLQFDVTAASGRKLTVTSVSFNYGAAGSTSAMRSNAWYSINNWSSKTQLNTDSTLVYGNSTMAAFAKSINVAVPVGSKFSVRIYPWWGIATTTSTSKYAVHNTLVIAGTTTSSTGVEQTGTGIPAVYELQQNYPNPFNPTTHIEFALPRESRVRLEVFNMLGQRVATLVDETRPAGYHAVQFDASHLAGGMYVYRFEAGGFVQTKKLTLVR